MTAGHFGLAAAVKSSEPRIPLWSYMTATYLLDIVFIILVPERIEWFEPLHPGLSSYGQVIIHAYYTHSLFGAAILALIAGLLAKWAWGKKSGFIIGGVAFSHWVLDLIVHRPDLPILPGNLGHLPLLGFGLWRLPVASALLELMIAIAGTYLYFRSALASLAASSEKRRHKSRAVLSSLVLGVSLLALLALDYFSLSVSFELLLMLWLIIGCGWLDARLHWASLRTKPNHAMPV